MNDTTEAWHESFFHGAWTEVQPRSFSPEESRATAETVRELLQLPPDGRVLDVPCGEGRVAQILADWGFRVTGIDRSADFLDQARAKAESAGLDIDYRQDDMWSFTVDQTYDGAISLWSSIGYSGEEEDQRYFESIAQALASGGSFVLDTHVMETLLPDFQEHGWHRAGGVLVVEERHFDPSTSRVHSQWSFCGPQGVEEAESSIRIYSFRELVEMLRGAGFDDFVAYGSMELEPFSVGSSRLVLLAGRS